MNVFWFWALLLAGFASLFVLLPLLTRGRLLSGGASREGVNVALYAERLAELEATRSRGDITPQEYAQLEIEAQRDLLLDTAAVSETVSATAPTRRGLLPLMLAALLVPLVTVLVFADFGLGLGSVSDLVLSEKLSQELSQELAIDPHSNTGYRQLVEQLAARMSAQPDEIKGQLLLARSWSRLREPARAALVYEQLMRRFPQDVNLAAYYAESLFAADGQQMTARVEAALAAVLTLKPDTGRVLRVLVEVADSVTVPEDAVVFVYARAWEGGPPAPLAVRRLTRADLPTMVRLDESMAMIQGMGLAEFDKVQIIARIAATGTVAVSDEDYEARSPAVDLTGDNAVIKLLVEHHRHPPDKPEP